MSARTTFFQKVEGRGPLLGVDLGQVGGLVAGLEEMLALGDDGRLGVAVLTDKDELVFQVSNSPERAVILV